MAELWVVFLEGAVVVPVLGLASLAGSLFLASGFLLGLLACLFGLAYLFLDHSLDSFLYLSHTLAVTIQFGLQFLVALLQIGYLSLLFLLTLSQRGTLLVKVFQNDLVIDANEFEQLFGLVGSIALLLQQLGLTLAPFSIATQVTYTTQTFEQVLCRNDKEQFVITATPLIEMTHCSSILLLRSIVLLLEVAYLTLEAVLFGNEGFYLAMLAVDKRLTLANLVGTDLDIAILAFQRSIVVTDEFLGIANLLLQVALLLFVSLSTHRLALLLA